MIDLEHHHLRYNELGLQPTIGLLKLLSKLIRAISIVTLTLTLSVKRALWSILLVPGGAYGKYMKRYHQRSSVPCSQNRRFEYC